MDIQNENFTIEQKNAFKNILGNTVASYKLYFFKALIKFAQKNIKTILLTDMVKEMVIESWAPANEFLLNFGRADRLGYLAKKLKSELNINDDIRGIKLRAIISENWEMCLNTKGISSNIKDITKMVPQRLIRPFFTKELSGLKDSAIDRTIRELTREHKDRAMYYFSDDDMSITINEKWAEFFKEKDVILTSWANFELVKYLQLKNPTVPNIVNKLELIDFRTNSELTKIKGVCELLYKERMLSDIFLNEHLIDVNEEKYGVISYDHFIPWKFIGHDEIWNISPIFHSVNSSKNSKLASKEYVEEFTNFQWEMFTYIVRSKDIKKTIRENYLVQYAEAIKDIDYDNLFDYEVTITKEVFKDNLSSVIISLWELAYNQGFSLWNFDANVYLESRS